MATLDLLEARGLISKVINNTISKGVDPMTCAALLDSVKADVLMTVPYKALAEQQEENENEPESSEEEKADV